MEKSIAQSISQLLQIEFVNMFTTLKILKYYKVQSAECTDQIKHLLAIHPYQILITRSLLNL
jgi:hypothetical protein